MPKRPLEGRSAVTRRAITDIIRTAVRGSYGVAGFATPTPAGHLLRILGLREPGIVLGTDDPMSIDLHLRVAYGLPIAEVARQIDSAVRYALRRDLGRDVADVTIHVDGLEYNPGRIPEVPVASAEEAPADGAPTETIEPEDSAHSGPGEGSAVDRASVGGAA